MRVIKNIPIVERKPVTIEFTPKEVDLLYEICRNIAGTPYGPRGFVDNLGAALSAEGAVSQGLVNRSSDKVGIMLKDSW